MLRKRIAVVSVAAVAAALAFTGCSKAVKSNTVSAVTLSPNVESSAMLADLDVSEKKVSGNASGSPLEYFSGDLKQLAVANAVAQREGADVLVGVTFFTEESGFLWWRSYNITVTGFPATYKNFRVDEREVSYVENVTETKPRHSYKKIVVKYRPGSDAAGVRKAAAKAPDGSVPAADSNTAAKEE